MKHLITCVAHNNNTKQCKQHMHANHTRIHVVIHHAVEVPAHDVQYLVYSWYIPFQIAAT